MAIENKTAGGAGTNYQSSIVRCKSVEVSAALIFRKGKLLITQRPAGTHLAGLWEFPGGKREPHETFEQCLVRELREELGITARIGKLFEEITHSYADSTVQLKFFLCELTAGDPQPLACAGIRWIGKSELADYDFPAADARLLEKLKRLNF